MSLIDGTLFANGLHNRYNKIGRIWPPSCFVDETVLDQQPDTDLLNAQLDALPRTVTLAYFDEFSTANGADAAAWNFDTDRSRDQSVMDLRAGLLASAKARRPDLRWGYYDWPVPGNTRLRNFLGGSAFDTWYANNLVIAARCLYDRQLNGDMTWPSALLGVMSWVGVSQYWHGDALLNVTGYTEATGFVFGCRRVVSVAKFLGLEVIPFLQAIDDADGTTPVPALVTDLYPTLSQQIGVNRCIIWSGESAWDGSLPIVDSLKVRSRLGL